LCGASCNRRQPGRGSAGIAAERCLRARYRADLGVGEMHVLVAGGFDEDDPQSDDIRVFSRALGKAVANHGHVLLSGARTELDALTAEAVNEALQGSSQEYRNQRIISYVLPGQKPIHTYGMLIRSQLSNWEIGRANFYVPEQVARADVVVLIKGFEGTFRAANWAEIARKPLLPFAAFGGAAAEIYQRELSDFDKKYSGRIERLEFEQLNSIKDWANHATDVIDLAEKVAESRSVLVVMSYADHPYLKDAYGTFRRICHELGYSCERVTEKNAVTRILPEILERIRQAAFIIVDLTDLRPNVFYELGYADGLGGKVIVTARKGTELPFDVKDIPTILWESQEELGEDLQERIQSVVKSAVPRAATPIGPSR
jgi:hypothetical protein